VYWIDYPSPHQLVSSMTLVNFLVYWIDYSSLHQLVTSNTKKFTMVILDTS
jgi:hypothetical protein